MPENILFDIVSKFGSPHVNYTGKGQLKGPDEIVWDCSFHACQLEDGQVLLACHIAGPPYPDPWNFAPLEFTGISADSLKLHSQGILQETNVLHENVAEGYWAVYKVQELVAEKTDLQNQEIGLERFGIANLNYTVLRDNRRLSLVHNEQTVSVELVSTEGYREKIRASKTLRTIALTHEAQIKVEHPIQLPSLRTVIDNLCYLLSVSTGTKVQWIYNQEDTEDGVLIRRTHASRITRRYSSFALIDPRNAAHAMHFVEGVYARYVNKKTDFSLPNLIDAWLSARADHDYLETRGAKLVIALEMLRHVSATTPGLANQPFVIKQSDYEALIPGIAIAVNNFLQKEGIPANSRQALSNEGKIRSLNRRSFGSMLRILFKKVGFKPDKQEIDLFIKCRDSLVHTGSFYFESATKQQRLDRPPLASKIEEYLFLISFLDRIILKTLGYSGEYLDWRQTPPLTENLQ